MRFRLGLSAFCAASCLLLLGAAPSYDDSIRAWQKQRDEGLRAPDSWLTLVGLQWLKAGDNTVSGFGRLRLEGAKLVFTKDGVAGVTVNNKPVTAPVPIGYDDENPDVVRSGSLSFYVIRRSDKLGVRIKDSNSPNLKHITGLQYFPIDPALHFANARLISDPKKIPILNIVGQTDLEDSPGPVEFTYQGRAYRLRPIYEGKTLFFLFKDLTNKADTYQAGRMLNADLPVDGKVDLDFNRAYNPPCTFTPYATCPLPPKENSLSFAVAAGEMRYGNGHVE
jgi:uncharacterized protein (DUF1684 family)